MEISPPMGMHEIWSQKLDTLRYHTVETRSLSHFGLVRYRVVADRQTDRQNCDSYIVRA